MNVSPPQSSAGLPPPESGTFPRPRSISRASRTTAHSRPGTAHSTRYAEDTDIPDVPDVPKTAVKVAVRVRPPLQSSDPAYDLIPNRFRGSTCNVGNPTTLTVESSQGKKLFVFDRVFSDREDQESIWEYVSGSVDAFIQGYNVSILAYGQSGAGKSYTMGTASPGELDDPASIGIIPRASASLFEKLGGASARPVSMGSGIRPPKRYGGAQTGDGEKNWQLKASYVEIYNEQLRDLLVPDSVPGHERNNVTIREDTRGRIILTGVQQIPINSVDDLMNALNFGSSIRQTDSTNINSKSSRSHAVFSLNLIQKKSKAGADKRSSMDGPDQFVTTDSKLHFVDLAGSERLKNSGLSGERVKEGISINAGLASLGKVISQLSSRSAGHVSYRDSRLTRLLQDSLGGTAITYMVACVNPVEFHLSETLNTVQYAQRARAIQSKPQIQQRAEDGDKQLVIDRLRSEVAFLRDQIRSSERSERKSGGSHERTSRQSDRENELQNQLLDVQESYSALSQRHAKLIADIAKSKGGDPKEDLPALKGALGTSSLERLNRSNTFAEAVEQVVLEYEKTIQSLESSLSNTRSSLSTSESSLLEREAKLVYMEAVTQQLQARVQKAMEREGNSDSYLKGLESKLETASSSEERHMIVIQELRSELLRIRESESSAEEYISTLEERLAEAEQDTEIMQREIRRLEHVVERQRTVGKIDILDEGDQSKKEAAPTQPSRPEAFEDTTTDMFHDRLVATTTAQHPNGEMLPENAEEEWKSFGPMEGDDETASQVSFPADRDVPVAVKRQSVKPEGRVTSQAQARAIADKLETVTIELFELKVDHEKTCDELDNVSHKYQIALSTLADLQDAMGDSKPRPVSFLENQNQHDLDGQLSSARTLPSDLSSRGESPTLVESSEAGGSVNDHKQRADESLADSVRRLKRTNAEKDINMAELTENFSQLSDQHQTTLKYVEELKEELITAKTNKPAASNNRDSLASPTVIRRSGSSYTLSRDRESKAFDNLRSLAVENLQGKPQAAQSFDAHLTAAAVESKTRNERVDHLEAEIKSLRNEMEVKNTMISGLTRERSAVRTNPAMDVTMISTMRDHVMHSQKHLAGLFENGTSQHLDLLANMRDLQSNLNSHITSDPPALKADAADGEVPEVKGPSPADVEAQKQSILALQKEVHDWEAKHHGTMDAVQSCQQQLMATISGLETSLSNAEALHAERAASAALRAEMRSPDSNVDYEAEKAKHVDQVTSLQKEIDGYKATADTHAKKLLSLEASYEQIIKDVELDAKSRQLTESELQTHRDLVQSLEQQIEQQKSLASFHQDGLKSLEESHAKELDELRATLNAQQAQIESRMEDQLSRHKSSISSLQEELTKAHLELAGLMESVALYIGDSHADSPAMQARLRSMADERRDVSSAETERTDYKRRTLDLESQLKELSGLNEQTLQELEASNSKEKRHHRMVRELEEQLNASFSTHKQTESRLFESQNMLQEHRNRISRLETELGDVKRGPVGNSFSELNRSPSEASNLRKSSSHGSLPSPPPALPLPPLPTSNLDSLSGPPARSPARGLYESSRPSSPRPRTSERESAALAAQAQHQADLEEKEQRIKTIEKHLYAEKQLTQTLEEALVDLEAQANKTKAEVEAWKKKCREVEEEATSLRRERGTMRNSLQAVEEERDRRIRAEMARKQLEERMEQLGKKKKKQGTLNCF